MEVVDEEVVLRNKKHYQNEQFNTIVKALLYFESKLKSDQKNIRQILFEKDEIINRQWNEIINFKKRYNDNTKIEEIDDVAKYCPKCRKNYYLLEKKNVEIQTFNGRGESKESISPQSVEFLSSSEDSVFEKSSSFAGARRSKKYTSKRTSGNYSEYIRSRQSSNSSPNSNKDVKYSCRINNMHGIKQDYEPVQVKTENYDSSHNELNSSENEYSDEFQSKEFETTDDWYASASDIEDSDCNIIKPYGHNAINPVLECVNQILLQQSMDGFLDGTNSDTPDLPVNQQQNQQTKDSTLTRQKRVHFSTQNSMVQVPRNITPPPSESNNSNSSSKVEEKNNSYEVQSIYSNEYEPIGSEHNSSNYYIDMESKIGQEDKTKYEKSNKPPDLPPKPPNLMKRKQFPKFYIPHVAKSIISSNSSEPDYCSISEINVTAKIVQIVADVHKTPSSKNSEEGGEEFKELIEIPLKVEAMKTESVIDDETFADIPKLPNVAAIIPPKKEPLKGFIIQDNYIINKSPLKTTELKKQIPLVLSEISPTKKTIHESPKKSPKINLISESISNVKIIEDKMPMQAEFDWYNLDAEYGKVLQPDIIQETDSSDLLEKDDDEFTEDDDIPKIEYILDDEYNPVIQPDLVIQKSTTEPIFKPALVDTPKIYRNRNESYDKFLDDSGFCVKPILTKRKKVYYSGPYV